MVIWKLINRQGLELVGLEFRLVSTVGKRFKLMRIVSFR